MGTSSRSTAMLKPASEPTRASTDPGPSAPTRTSTAGDRPPTLNRLDTRQRARLVRSARKLGAVLGTTPLLDESEHTVNGSDGEMFGFAACPYPMSAIEPPRTSATLNLSGSPFSRPSSPMPAEKEVKWLRRHASVRSQPATAMDTGNHGRMYSLDGPAMYSGSFVSLVLPPTKEEPLSPPIVDPASSPSFEQPLAKKKRSMLFGGGSTTVKENAKMYTNKPMKKRAQSVDIRPLVLRLEPRLPPVPLPLPLTVSPSASESATSSPAPSSSQSSPAAKATSPSTLETPRSPGVQYATYTHSHTHASSVPGTPTTASTATLTPTPTTPVFNIPSIAEMRRRRMAKLTRTLGELIPPHLVMCAAARSGHDDHSGTAGVAKISLDASVQSSNEDEDVKAPLLRVDTGPMSAAPAIHPAAGAPRKAGRQGRRNRSLSVDFATLSMPFAAADLRDADVYESAPSDAKSHNDVYLAVNPDGCSMTRCETTYGEWNRRDIREVQSQLRSLRAR